MGHLKSIYGIVYTAPQFSVNLCPQLLIMGKKGIQEKGVFEIMEGEGMDRTPCSAVRQIKMEKGGNWGGEGPSQMETCC